jgi:hypothetical protein
MSVGILYFGGLKGDKQFEDGYPASTHPSYADGISALASQYAGCEFKQVEYQTPAKKFPLVSDMGIIATTTMRDIATRHEDGVILIGNSVGAGAIMEGIGEYMVDGGKVAGIIMIGGVFDPIEAAQKLAGPRKLLTLMTKRKGTIHVPVSKADDQVDPGTFPMGYLHMHDESAIGFTRNAQMAKTQAFGTRRMLERARPPMHVFTARDDKFCPPNSAILFMQQTGADIERGLHIWEGKHNEKTGARFDDVNNAVADMLVAKGAMKLEPVSPLRAGTTMRNAL